VSRQKINAAAKHCSADYRVRRRAEGCLDLVFGQVGKIFQVVEAAAADNPDRWLLHPQFELKRKQNKKRSQFPGHPERIRQSGSDLDVEIRGDAATSFSASVRAALADDGAADRPRLHSG
jgi:hypothetical protein